MAQPLLPLRITEIMYQPTGGDPYQFLELQNFGSTTLDLTGCAVNGISFTFPVGFTIGPGAVIVLASGQNPAAFAARYPGVSVAAYFTGKLAKNGERIALEDALGRAVFAVNYSTTNGWPVPSGGRSIEIIDPTGDPDDPANWRLSASANGTPGTISVAPPPGCVLINEVMALNTGALTNGGTYPDWIELVNNGTNTRESGRLEPERRRQRGQVSSFPVGRSFPPAGSWWFFATRRPTRRVCIPVLRSAVRASGFFCLMRRPTAPTRFRSGSRCRTCRWGGWGGIGS